MAVVVLNPGAPKAPVPRGPPILGWLFPNKDACPAPRAMETRGKNKCHRRSFDYCASGQLLKDTIHLEVSSGAVISRKVLLW